MSNQYQTMPMEPEVQVKQPRGCVFYGCLTAVVMSIGAILCCGVGPYWFITSQVQKYTAEAPVAMPTVGFSEEQIAALETRLSTFKKKLDAGDTPQDLVLTADEINALIRKNKDLRGKVFVKIEDGEITGDISIPADAVWGGKGRYFNASASFNVSMEDGVLIVTMTGAEVKGERVPDEYMQAISKENLAKDVYKDPENAKMLRRFESIEIVDDKIVLKLRRDDKSTDEGESEDEESRPIEPVEATQPIDPPEAEAETGDAPKPSGDSGP